MQVMVGGSPVTVTQVGRMMASGNSGVHTVKLVKASDGQDVPGGSAAVSMSGGTPGQFRYGVLSNPVVLEAGTAYWVLSQETAGGDNWHDYINTNLTTTAVAVNNGLAWGTGPGAWNTFAISNQSYVPVNFKYTSSTEPVITVAATDATASEPGSGQGTGTFTFSRTGSTTAGLTVNFTVSGSATPGIDYTTIGTTVDFAAGASTATKVVSVINDGFGEIAEGVVVILASGSGYAVGSPSSAVVTIQDDDSAPEFSYVTGVTSLGAVRNGYSGWVGMQVVVGGGSLTVTQLGRMMASGNSGVHAVKLVKASDGQDVPGGSAAVSMSGGTPGQFRYGALSNPVVLEAGTAYWVLSQETSGGDSWHDYINTNLTTTAVAVNDALAWGSGPGAWNTFAVVNQSFVPVNFKYTPVAQPFVTVAATDAMAGEPGTGEGTGTFTFTRTGSTTGVLTVNFTVSGTATSGSDYTALGTTVDFAAGSATATKVVTVIDDAMSDAGETVIVTVAAGTGYAVGSPASATVTIQDDDSIAATSYVTNVGGLGSLRNNYSGWVGMQIQVAGNPVTVTQLGRMMAAGNSGMHTVKLVKASDGLDVPGGAVTIAMSGGTVGQFRYGTLSSPIALSAGTTYWLLSQETAGGDSWHDYIGTTLTTSAVAVDNALAWGTGPGAWNTYLLSNQAFVPVNFQYVSSAQPMVTVAATDPTAGESGTGQGTGTFTFTRTGSAESPLTVNYTVSGSATAGSDYMPIGNSVNFAGGASTATVVVNVIDDAIADAGETVVVTLAAGAGYVMGDPSSAVVSIQDDDGLPDITYVTSTVLGSLRNNYSGWVGMQIQVAGNPVTVTQLGRMMAAGNSGMHTVKLVKASDGLDVPGGAVTIAMSGGTVGQFRYGTLSSPVMLSAGTTYWLLSQETAGGDSWHDYLGTTLTTSAVAVDNALAWGTGPGAWNTYVLSNQSFVPLDFQYQRPPGPWIVAAPMPIFRAEHNATVHNNKIYAAGGFSGTNQNFIGTTAAFQVYDPAADTWTNLAAMPEARHHVGIAALDDNIYVTGGYAGDTFDNIRTGVYVYNLTGPSAGTWTSAAPLPHPRAAHASVALGGLLYVIGGVGSDPITIRAYNPATNSWDSHRAPMPILREHMVAAVVNNKIYVISGRWGTQNLANVEEYDPATNLWTPKTPIPTPRSGITCAVLNGKIHVTGGEDQQDMTRVFDEHEVYDPATNTWASLPALPTARHGHASGVVNNRWYVSGGFRAVGPNTFNSLTNVVEVFVP